MPSAHAIASNQSKMPKTVIVGLGVTGLSCAQFLHRQGVEFALTDSRQDPPQRAEFIRQFPDTPLVLGGFDSAMLGNADSIILSPGVSPQEPVIELARQQGTEIIGDIELFARHCTRPVAAITGSNGKSTVTTLLGEMIKRSGRQAGVGGNLGTPALQILDDPEVDVFVLELSSFQLELTDGLRPRVATVLNVSSDHLDRHGSMENYAAAKQKVLAGAKVVVLNADDPVVAAMAGPDQRTIRFSLATPRRASDFGVDIIDGQSWMMQGQEPLLAVGDLRMPGRHNVANALAAYAMGTVLEVGRESMLETLCTFSGLAHRCQWVASHQGIDWFDDSKGTNVGATCAAIAGLGAERQLILIAGGDGKGQDFHPLALAARGRVRGLVALGKDGPAILQAMQGICRVELVASMSEAVAVASQLAEPGDAVLLSPACSSLDMFKNYVERAEVFVNAVGEVIKA